MTRVVRVTGLDHVVLTVRDLDRTIDFYEGALGMRAISFAQGRRRALLFGDQKINLHRLGDEFLPNASVARPGTADLCFLIETPLDQAVAHLEARGVDIEHGPAEADGARGPLRSVWFRDPDGNLVEVASPVEPGRGACPPGKRTRAFESDPPCAGDGGRWLSPVADGLPAWSGPSGVGPYRRHTCTPRRPRSEWRW